MGRPEKGTFYLTVPLCFSVAGLQLVSHLQTTTSSGSCRHHVAPEAVGALSLSETSWKTLALLSPG